ncbi:DUF1573 domain-containing protein [Pontiella desulfatans]|uniref:DUF1573 domain-containing protein n=1 Tax=Pontiella desulfatans TaxID=2750659 RepID=UPI00109C8D35
MILSFHHPDQKLLSLCFLNLFVAIPSLARPKLGCESPKYDFGTVIGQEKIPHEFILKNTGDEPVVVSRIKTCCNPVMQSTKCLRQPTC